MNQTTSGAVSRPRRTLKRIIATASMAVAVFFSVLIGATPAHADGSSCGFASGTGYVCTYVANNGTWIDHVWSNRSKLTPPEICRSSAWAYYVPPWGGAYDLGYTWRDDCVYGTARAYINVRKWVPSGSRVCTKFMEFGEPVGPEPCVYVR